MNAPAVHAGLLFADSVALRADAVALIDDVEQLTYAQLDAACDRVAGALVDRGIQPGDRVGVLWANRIGYAAALFGAMRAGAAAVPLNRRASDSALLYALDDCGARLLLVDDEHETRARHLCDQRAQCRVLTRPDVERLGAAVQIRAIAADGVCLVMYTSGSTGRPKGVPLTHEGVVWNVRSMNHVCMLTNTDRALISAPLAHKNGGGTLKQMLGAGASAVILPVFDPLEVLTTLAQHRCTCFGLVPAMLQPLIEARQQHPEIDLGTLAFVSVGSASTDGLRAAEFEALFDVPLLDGYGLTEGGPDVLSEPRWGVRRRGSLGLPIPGCEIRLVNTDNQDVGTDVVGELLVRNPGVTPGYLNLPEVTTQRLYNGWLRTGDLMHRDRDGFIYFHGRTDDLINVAGENVYPAEVEAVLLQHTAVREVAVTALSHDIKGAVPGAVIVLRDGAQVSVDELKDFFLRHGPAYAHPRRIRFDVQLPTNQTGKVDRQAVRRLLEDCQ